MDRSQAEAMADAMLQPDPKREAVRARRLASAAQLKRQRKAAGASLVGMAVGAAVASQFPMAFSQGMLIGALLTYFPTQLWLDRRARGAEAAIRVEGHAQS
ncbi:hypothetical protein [Stenotrophomonas sp. Ste96]|jgi:uncharacterized membrane protein YfcA|uniref:hypothetical protein n=1 Tax=Stenotrophomonas sp. Ste96 TaxID=2926029 RepID=UPI0021C99CED|nr:hypothetical protein [Stenotrophomonas sp. Ste96]